MMTLLKTFFFLKTFETFENINRITLMWTGGPMYLFNYHLNKIGRQILTTTYLRFQVNSVSTSTNEV